MNEATSDRDNTTMTPEETLARLRTMADEQNDNFDPEGQHQEGDTIICALLRHLGYDEIADCYSELTCHWWYA